MMHNYKFVNGNGTVTRVTRSHKLNEAEMAKYMANAGNNVTYTPEQFDRVEQTYKQVAEQLQVELDQMTARLATECEHCPTEELNQQLKARVARLEGVLADMPHEYETEYDGCSYTYCCFCDATISEEDHSPDCSRTVLNETPAQSLSAIKADALEEVAKFVEMQEGECFDPKVMAAAIRGNLKYGDYFSFFAAALREGE